MIVKPVEIRWHSGLPIFASESFLRAVGDDYGWLGGFKEDDHLCCILPYTIIRKMRLRMVRFRAEAVRLGDDLDMIEEKEFLNAAMVYLRAIGADVVIPASNNAIFRTYPDGAIAAPYGSYFIDLNKPEEVLWRNIDRIMRQNIKTAQKDGVTIRSGLEYLEPAYRLIRETFKRSQVPFMKIESFRRFVQGLGENGIVMMAEFQGAAQSYVVFAFSEFCAYAIYAGNIIHQHQGANKLLYWEAIRIFKGRGIRRFDFMGARIDPEKGSKQEALSLFKKRFGTELRRGYMWKYPLRQWGLRIYNLAARIRSGGDIVDAEHHKMKEPEGPKKEPSINRGEKKT